MVRRYCEVCVVEGAPEISSCSPCAKIAVDEDTGALYYRNPDGDWTAVPGGVGGDNAFSTIAVAGQSNVVAEIPGDTLTLVAGTNVTLTTSAAGDSVTINAPVAGGGHPIGMMTTLENATSVPITGNTLINSFSTVPTTITEFTTAEPDGHMFVFVATDANTTIANNSSIATLDGANIVMAIGDVAFFIHNGAIARQVAPGGGTGTGLPAGGAQYDLLVKDSGTDGDATWYSSLHHLNIFTPGSLAVSPPALNITQTWDAIGTTFIGSRIAVTDTNSAAGSLPFQVLGGAGGATNLANVDKAGVLSVRGYGGGALGGFSSDNTELAIYVSSGASLIGRLSGAQWSLVNTVALSNQAPSSPDVFMTREAANHLALRNSTNAQSLSVYGTYTSGSVYNRLRTYYDGSAAYEITSEHVGDAVKNISISPGGSRAVLFRASDSNALFNAHIRIGGQSWIVNQADGVLRFSNDAFTDFGRLQLGGTTSSFPAIKRSGTGLQIRLADDSAFTTLEASSFITTGGTLTASTPNTFTQTWNNAGVTFEGVKIAITDTASAAASLPFQVLGGAAGTTNLLSVSKAGEWRQATGSTANDYISIGGSANGILQGSSNALGISWRLIGDTSGGGGPASLRLGSTGDISWNSATGIQSGSIDLTLVRQDTDHLALRRGTNAQSLSVYNTYTSGSVYQRGRMGWDSGVLKIGTEHVGVTAGTLQLMVGGSSVATMDGTAIVVPGDSRIGLSTAASADIYFNATTFGMRSYGSMNFLIDANNDTSNAGFVVKKDDAAFGSATELVRVTESGMITFGGVTSSQPAIKPSGTGLQIRLADDSAFTKIQGEHQTTANAVAETITPTHTLTIWDAAGVAYKLPVVAV